MVAALPLDLSAADRKRAWMAQELAKLTPEEREQYENNAFFRGCVDLTLEGEWENPGPTPMEREAAEKYGGDMTRCFVEHLVAFALRDHSLEDAARIAALRSEIYGGDFARECQELQDGTHPVHQLR